MKRMFFCALLSTTIWAGVLENNYTKEEFNKIDNRSGEEIAKQYVEEILKEIPKQQGTFTTLTNATAINTKMYFTKELNKNKSKELKELLAKEEGKKALIKELFEKRKKEICKNNTDRTYLDKKNIGIQDDYYEANTKEYIGGFSIDKSDCIELDKQQKKRG